MLFTKTSQKFGQWTDVRANTVYGLGFASEADLNKFIEQFKEVKEATRLVAQKAQANGNVCQSSASNALSSASSLNHDEGRENNLSLSNQSNVHQRSHSLTSLQTPGESPHIKPKSPKSPTPSVSSSTSLPSNSIEAQLRYENDKLKIALAQSSTNAKKWEIELQTLKSNNSRLTTALQESTSNVEEWKKQLQAYKEECAQLKKTVQEMRTSQDGSPDDFLNLQKEVSELKTHIETIETENKNKDQEIEELNQRITDLTVIENCQGNEGRQLDLQADNTALHKKVGSLQEQLNITLRTNQAYKKRILELQTFLGIKLKEVGEIHDQIMAKMQS